jgi:hypothetical protein
MNVIFLGNEKKRRARERENDVGIEKACYEKDMKKGERVITGFPDPDP